MRILALRNKETDEYTAFTVVDVEFDEEVNGICFMDSTGSFYFIPDVSVSDVNRICQKLVVNGYCDVTPYGEIQVYGNENDEE